MGELEGASSAEFAHAALEKAVEAPWCGLHGSVQQIQCCDAGHPGFGQVLQQRDCPPRGVPVRARHQTHTRTGSRNAASLPYPSHSSALLNRTRIIWDGWIDTNKSPPPSDSLPREIQVLEIEGLCGTSKRWTDNLRGNPGSEGRGEGALPPATALPRRRADLEPHSSELFFTEFDLLLCIPGCRLSSPRGLRAFPAQVGGLLGGDRHERARMDRFTGAVSP